jgi:hypothetical protein
MAKMTNRTITITVAVDATIWEDQQCSLHHEGSGLVPGD